ncbi:MAG: DEAD/DEAH box helicase, partial [Caldimonas sp.]
MSRAASEPAGGSAFAEAWFAAHGWAPFAFQREVWAAMERGESGLLHATTGAGKTYAVWFGALARAQALGVPFEGAHAPPLGVLWLTPMRALAADTRRALQAPLDDPRAEQCGARADGTSAAANSARSSSALGARTGDTPSAER